MRAPGLLLCRAAPSAVLGAAPAEPPSATAELTAPQGGCSLHFIPAQTCFNPAKQTPDNAAFGWKLTKSCTQAESRGGKKAGGKKKGVGIELEIKAEDTFFPTKNKDVPFHIKYIC